MAFGLEELLRVSEIMNVADVDFEFSDEEDDDVSDGTISDIDSGSDSDEEASRYESLLLFP